MTELYDILEVIDLNEFLTPWKESLKNGWLRGAWEHLLESYPAEYPEDLCESISVFLTLMAVYITFTRIAWESVDLVEFDGIADSIDVHPVKFGLLAAKLDPEGLEDLLEADPDIVFHYALETIISTLAPEVISTLKKSYGGGARLYISLLPLIENNYFEDDEFDDEEAPILSEESIIANWEIFSSIADEGGDFETYMDRNIHDRENVAARWVIEGCPILWDRLGY